MYYVHIYTTDIIKLFLKHRFLKIIWVPVLEEKFIHIKKKKNCFFWAS